MGDITIEKEYVEMNKMKLLGRNIRIARGQKGYSQEILAELVNCSRERISDYENAKVKKMDYSLLKAISEVLDVDITKLEE